MNVALRTGVLPGERKRFERNCDPEAILGLLDDEDAIRLFQAATAPKTASELSEECDVPLSTTYTKLGALEDAGLLRAATDGPPAEYERAVHGVAVTVSDDVTVEGIAPGDG